MVASLLESVSLDEQVRSLLAEVQSLRSEVADLRSENAKLQQQVSDLRCESGYWKSRHADAVRRNVKLQAELDQAKAEIRQLKAERFGKSTEKQASSDRSNELVDPNAPVLPKKSLTYPKNLKSVVVAACRWKVSATVTSMSRLKSRRLRKPNCELS